MNRLQDLDTVNFMIRENHQRALRDEQARIIRHNLSPEDPRTTSLTRPVASFFERLWRTRVLFPRKSLNAG